MVKCYEHKVLLVVKGAGSPSLHKEKKDSFDEDFLFTLSISDVDKHLTYLMNSEVIFDDIKQSKRQPLCYCLDGWMLLERKNFRI